MLKSSYGKTLVEAGIDEAGRGCFAGPVVAAAVIFKKSYKNSQLNDSKMLSATSREMLRTVIEKDSLDFAVGIVGPEKIDEINILNATYLAMNEAVATLKKKPEFLLIDGNRFKNTSDIDHVCIVKGDQKYLSIAAASILAKTYRDDIMRALHEEFPGFGWELNKGYPTPAHKAAIARLGITRYHRKSFNLNEQLKLFH